MHFKNEKTVLRKKYRQKILALDDAFVDFAADAFSRIVCDSDVFRSADSVFVYISVEKEPATEGIIRKAFEMSKNVYVPKCMPDGNMAAVRIDRDTHFRLNSFSIPEPIEDSEQKPASELDLCIIPCIASSSGGVRLGHGGGYYDRFLVDTDVFKLCLCYEMNLLDRLPVEPHDVLMNAIVTENRMVACI